MAVGTGTPFDVMQDITGTHWAPGDGMTPKIRDWLDDIAASYGEMADYCRSAANQSYFEWCGLTVGYCMAMAGIKPIFGPEDVNRFLYATAWLDWGSEPAQPQQGDVVVFDWGGGHHHVTLFERDLGNGLWACRGGNQNNEVKISNYPADKAIGVRRNSAAPLVADAGAVAAFAAGAAPFGRVAAPVAGSVFQGYGTPLTQAALENAAETLGTGVAEIWALTFTETEAPYGGFYQDRRPQILFERHIFSRLSGGRFDAGYPDISSPHPGGYGKGGSHQYDRLSLAMSLDESAALQSASWGIGQVLGENYQAAGFASPQEMVTALFDSEDAQLLAVTNEILSDKTAKALAAHDWAAFARVYNGPNYAENNYDTTLRTNYEKFSGGASPDLRVRTAQLYLMYLGYHPSEIDGSWGKRSRAAMNEFQTAEGLPVTQSLDDGTFNALVTKGSASPGAELRAQGENPMV